MKTPVLFLVFNRPVETGRVFAEIRAARPEHLYIAADGPRTDRPDDVRLCAEVRGIVSTVDWPCEVRTLFRDSNLGCRKAVSSGIDWFFSQAGVTEGIILEDDCLPGQSFFPFCEDLLARYRDDTRIMMISGLNAAGHWPGEDSYVFSKYASIWGWATWKRAWQAYDVDMKNWNDLDHKARARAAINDDLVWKSKQWTYDRVYAGTKDTWDYQWEFAMLVAGGLNIIPRANLIENIGLGGSATHTADSAHAGIPARSSISFPLRHPGTTASDRRYEELWVRRFKRSGSLRERISARIRAWLH